MENNIFFREKKDKFNPDIKTKLTQKETERCNTTFQLSTTIYNPITGIVPNKITETKDLLINTSGKNTNLTKLNIQQLIMEKEEERKNQDTQFKPVQTKIVSTPSQPIQSQPIQSQPIQSQTNYIATYYELKNTQHNGPKKQDRNNYSNILDGLKGLGIIK
jgi:hypothetical protein